MTSSLLIPIARLHSRLYSSSTIYHPELIEALIEPRVFLGGSSQGKMVSGERERETPLYKHLQVSPLLVPPMPVRDNFETTWNQARQLGGKLGNLKERRSFFINISKSLVSCSPLSRTLRMARFVLKTNIKQFRRKGSFVKCCSVCSARTRAC